MSDNDFIEHAGPPSPTALPPAYDDQREPASNFAQFQNSRFHGDFADDHSEHVEHHEHHEHEHHEHEHHEHEHHEHVEHHEHEHVEHQEHAQHDGTPSQSETPSQENVRAYDKYHIETATNSQHGHPASHSAPHGHSASHSELMRPGLSRRSTIMLNEEELPASSNHVDFDGANEEGPFSRAQEGEQVGLDHGSSRTPRDGLVETMIEWREGGHNVFVTGSFTGWRQMIPLRRFEENVFAVVLKLAPGTHRLRFVVDGELRCSNEMNTATDSMGNLVNYMEVGVPEDREHHAEYAEPYSEEGGVQHEYTREIPEIFVDPDALDRFSSIDFTPPPQLPPHLDSVILNANWTEKDNNSVLPIPNHVVLNHLATTSIKHNVLAVASVSRYKAKYVTQILYSPIEGISK